MPLVKVDTRDGRLTELHAALAAARSLPGGVPVVVMIHGYRFDPCVPAFDPHAHIMALAPRRDVARAVSWPGHLGVGRAAAVPEPLCIAFGWPARGSIWGAWRRAARASVALAVLIGALRDAMGADRPGGVQVIAHSLGARVALGAVAGLPSGAIGRMILLSGAALRRQAVAALQTPAGQRMEVVNVTCGANAVFDALLRCALGASDRTIGAGLADAPARWLDLPIDDPEVRQGLARLGVPVAPSSRRVCHWSGYLRPGLFALYRRVLSGPDAMPMATLRGALPDRPTPAAWRAAWRGVGA